MSDLQDLIHKTSIDCIEKGQRMERERIIKLLEDIKNKPQLKQENWLYKVARTAYADATIRLIKGETK